MREAGATRPAHWRALGVGVIWLFLLVFLVYPLIRIFYDAVTDEGGRFTLDNFLGFFRDGFYLRALWKSLILGVATVVASFILGRAGSINVLLMDAFDMLKPINFLYGIHGVVLVETLHLFPMITLNVVDALGKIDPALEEAAESVGARGWKKFWTV